VRTGRRDRCTYFDRALAERSMWARLDSNQGPSDYESCAAGGFESRNRAWVWRLSLVAQVRRDRANSRKLRAIVGDKGRSAFSAVSAMRSAVRSMSSVLRHCACRRQGQDSGSSMFSNVRTSASFSKCVSRLSSAMPPCSAAAAAISASVSGTR
jgi:hypothetical protein